jgi:ribosome-binding protein aMBF1 (putative translation factor)
MSKNTTKRKPSEVVLARIPDAAEREARRRGVEAARLRMELAQAVHDLRERAGMSQADLAEQVGTKQPNISRLENGDLAGLPSLDLLSRVASALDGRLDIRIVRRRKRAKHDTTAARRRR